MVASRRTSPCAHERRAVDRAERHRVAADVDVVARGCGPGRRTRAAPWRPARGRSRGRGRPCCPRPAGRPRGTASSARSSMNSTPISVTSRRQPLSRVAIASSRQHLVARHPVAEHRASCGRRRLDWRWVLDRASRRILASSCGTTVPHHGTPDQRTSTMPDASPAQPPPGPRRSTAPPLLVATVVHADEPIAFADLQEACGLAKSTTSRLLTALERTGLLERDGVRLLRRRPALLAVRRPARPVGRAGAPRPARPWSAIGERHRRDRQPRVARGDRVVQVAQVDSPLHARHPRLDRGRRARPLLRARQGASTPTTCSPLPAGPLERRTAATLADADDAAPRRRSAIRGRGWAATDRRARGRAHRRRRPGARRPTARSIAALGISGPTPRLEGRLDEIGRHLLDQAAQLSAAARRQEASLNTPRAPAPRRAPA